MSDVASDDELRLYREVFHSSPDPVLVMEAKTRRIVEVNPAAEKFYGYSRERFLELTGLDVSAEPSETQKDMDRVHRGDRSHILVRYHRKSNGSVAAVEISGGACSTPNGDYVYGMIRPLDTLDEDRMRDRELAREVEHRLKNALATIRGLLWISKDSCSSVSEFAAELGDRIQSMANLHESLAGRGWGHANLERLVEDCTLRNPRIHKQGTRLIVAAGTAIPLGQVVFELYTNSVRHGALSIEVAHVDVAWERLPEGGGILRWAEVGGPPASTPPRPGIGTALLRGLVEKEIGGSIRLDYRPDGLRVAIELPRAAFDVATGA